jgi:hypothetical protein
LAYPVKHIDPVFVFMRTVFLYVALRRPGKMESAARDVPQVVQPAEGIGVKLLSVA